ncbi:GmrSD restriction endonuclease domain-containing protein [Actinopolyspora lacussalsi]
MNSPASGHQTTWGEPGYGPRLDSGGYSQELDQERESAEDRIQEPFDPEHIDVRTRSMTIDLLLARLRRGVLDLTPDFQRRSDIWKPENQSRLIESLLLRIPLPSFYAAENEDETWAMVDGVQRLTTIARFIQPESIGKEPLRLQGLEYLKYDGYTYEDLPGRLQTRLVETEVLIHLIGKTTPEEVKFNIFGRINTGGTPLSLQELRHALIPGRARDLLAELSESESFQRATRGSVNDARMSDREMVLRFLAFSITDLSEYTSNNLDAFLQDAMKKLNHWSEERIEGLKKDFEVSMSSAMEIFGEHAFRKALPGQHGRNPINKALFETISVSLARLSESERRALAERRERVVAGLGELLNEREFNESVSVATGYPKRVRTRFRGIMDLFVEVIDG